MYMKINTRLVIALIIILSLTLSILVGCDQVLDIFGAFNSPSDLEIHMIDVGQGESILIVTPNDKTILIDAGESSQGKKVKSYLRKNYISKIDLLIGSHPHADHIGGLAEIINNFEIGQIIMPEKLHTTVTFEKLLSTIESKGLAISPPPVGNVIEFDTDINLHFLGPLKDYGDNLNLWSLVFRLDYKNNSFLFTGDMEELAETDLINTYGMVDLNADVLNIGHHGSSTSTTQEFLNHVNPEIALISLGKDNSYGHPHKEVMERLMASDILIYRTDLQGTVVIISDGYEIWSNQAPVNSQ